jgi:L-iditol 2-dehydrogenase
MLRSMMALIRDAGLKLATCPVPKAAVGEVLVSVRSAGICRTDVYVADGQLPVSEPRVLGHEAAGVVEVGDARFEAGSHVVVDPALSCRALSNTPCLACARGTPCAVPVMLGVDRDGAFADLMAVPSRALYRVPASVPWEHAAMAEPVAAALGVLRAPIDRHGRGAVCGQGRIADLLVRVLEAAGFSLIPWCDEPRDLDWVIEARATEATFEQAMRALRPGGTLVLKSRPPKGVAIDVAYAVRRELTLVARSYGAFDDAIAWLASGRIALDDLVGETYPIERFDAAFAQARTDERQKIFFTMEP